MPKSIQVGVGESIAHSVHSRGHILCFQFVFIPSKSYTAYLLYIIYLFRQATPSKHSPNWPSNTSDIGSQPIFFVPSRSPLLWLRRTARSSNIPTPSRTGPSVWRPLSVHHRRVSFLRGHVIGLGHFGRGDLYMGFWKREGHRITVGLDGGPWAAPLGLGIWRLTCHRAGDRSTFDPLRHW